jgi:prephenate dehydratase
MRLGYLGPPGTFSEEAARRATATRDAELIPFASIHEAVIAVDRGEVDRALVPVENSLEGGVTATLDALAWDAPDTVILGEAVLPIRNCLIAREEIALEAIELVISHPQPLAQCARFLRDELRGAAVRAAASTAEAVRAVGEEVDDEPGNATRFVWLGAAGSEPVESDGAGSWKTSVVFAGAGDAQPGWLVRCLSEFAFRGVNLTKIESRPRRGRLGHYLFHVDMEGRAGEPSVDDAVQALHAHCEEVRLLGTYPAA